MYDLVLPDPFAFQKGRNLVAQGELFKAQVAETQAQARQRQVEADAKADLLGRQKNFLMRVSQPRTPGDPATTALAGTDFPDAEAELRGGPDTSPLFKPTKPDWQIQFENAQREGELKEAARAEGLFADADKYADNERLALEAARKGREADEKKQAQEWDQAAELTRSVVGEESLNRVLSQAEARTTGVGKQLGFKKNPITNRWIWDDDAIAKVNTIRDVVDAKLEERKFAHEKAKLEETKQENLRRDQRAEEKQTLMDQKLALQRQSVSDARDKALAEIEVKMLRLQAEETRATAKRDDKIVTNLQNKLDKDPSVQVLPKYDQAYRQSQSVFEAIQADPKYERINAPQLDTLKSAYTSMKNQFRQRAGGKWEDQAVSRFNGLMQNMDKWVSTLGQGTPAVDRTVAMNMANAMQEMYGIAAAEALKVELNTLKAAGVSKIDPERLQLKVFNDNGTLELLVKKGYLKVDEKKGKITLFGQTFDKPTKE